MTEYPSVETIRQRLPYSANALGFDDSQYDDVLEELRTDETERIETWGSVVTDQERADTLHDGSDPRTAFEEFEVTQKVDGRHALRTRRETERTRHRRTRNSDNRFDLGGGSRRYQDRTRRRTLPLPGRPASDVESVTLIDRDIELEVDQDVYLESSAVLVLDRDAPVHEWPQGRRNVEVTYTFGSDGVPVRIRDALVDLVHVRLMKDDTLPVESESIDGESVTYREPGELLSSVFGAVLSETEESHRGGVFSA